jgi:hypothetical protein
MSVPFPTPTVNRSDLPAVEAKEPELYTWAVEGTLPPYGNRKFSKPVTILVMANTLEEATAKTVRHYGSITLVKVIRERKIERVIT